MDKGDKLLFRNGDGDIKDFLSFEEGYTFQESPLDFYIILARYKFAARLLKKGSVADVGCGQGIGSTLLAKFANRVVGFDFDKEMIERNKKCISLDNVLFHRLNLLDEVSPNHLEQFENLVSMDVIEHFKPHQFDTVISNYKNLLKPSGIAFIGTPNIVSQKWASERRIQTHEHEFEPDEFKELLERHFENVLLFSMTDETVSTQFNKLAWYLMAVCVK